MNACLRQMQISHAKDGVLLRTQLVNVYILRVNNASTSFFTIFHPIISYLPHILLKITSFLLPIWSTFDYEASVLSLDFRFLIYTRSIARLLYTFKTTFFYYCTTLSMCTCVCRWFSSWRASRRSRWRWRTSRCRSAPTCSHTATPASTPSSTRSSPRPSSQDSGRAASASAYQCSLNYTMNGLST